MADMRVIVAGAGGRMGRALTRLIAEAPGLELVGAVEPAQSPLIGQDAIARGRAIDRRIVAFRS